MKSMEEKVALITGSTAGIGKEIALSLAAEGYAVILNGRRDEEQVINLITKLNTLNNKKGKNLYIRGSVSEAETREKIVKIIQKEFGALHLLVNNAAITTVDRKDILELEEENIQKVLGVNLVGPLLLTSALSKIMMNQDSFDHIINISSISAYTISTNRADYCISKAGMSMMTELFAARLAAHKVRVFELRPGIIRTDMTEPVQDKYDKLIAEGLLPIARWGEPSDIANAVLGIVKGYFNYATGEIINIDGGFHIRRL